MRMRGMGAVARRVWWKGMVTRCRERFETAMLAVYRTEKARRTKRELVVMGVRLK